MKQQFPKARWEVMIEYKLCAYRNEQFKDILTLGSIVYIDDPKDEFEFVKVGPMALKQFVNNPPWVDEVSTAAVVQIAKMTPADIPGFWQSNLVRN